MSALHESLLAELSRSGARVRSDGHLLGALRSHRLAYGSDVDANGCWIWRGNTERGGYGRIKVGKSQVLVHRLSYAEFVGPIPADMTIDHLCFVPACCNPEHLRLASLSDNARRKKASLAPTCSNGHEWTAENSLWTPGRGGRRVRRCRACARVNQRNNEARDAELLSGGSLEHGIGRTYTAGCRCDACRRWRHEKYLERKLRAA